MLGLNLRSLGERRVQCEHHGRPHGIVGLSSELDQNSLNVSTRGTQWYIGFAGEIQISFLFVNAGYDVAMSNVFESESFSTNPKANFYHIAAGARLALA
ncbi:MAG: hypothetical protein IPP33_13275, partial [Flavobacteriales bacterium]|nr:hypothetical protein [Flavobacteriales bacterium]